MKSLEHNDKSHKLQKILLSLYKDCHYSLQALRELRDLSQALAKKVSRPLYFVGCLVASTPANCFDNPVHRT